MSEHDHELSDRRKRAIALARSFGWHVTRKSSKTWEFRRPDTGGWWDLFRISHAALSETAVLIKFEIYEPDLGTSVSKAVSEARSVEHAKWLLKHRPMGIQP